MSATRRQAQLRIDYGIESGTIDEVLARMEVRKERQRIIEKERLATYAERTQQLKEHNRIKREGLQ